MEARGHREVGELVSPGRRWGRLRKWEPVGAERYTVTNDVVRGREAVVEASNLADRHYLPVSSVGNPETMIQATLGLGVSLPSSGN